MALCHLSPYFAVHHSKDDTDLSKAADRVLNELLEVSQRKAVDIQFEFMFMTTEASRSDNINIGQFFMADYM